MERQNPNRLLPYRDKKSRKKFKSSQNSIWHTTLFDNDDQMEEYADTKDIDKENHCVESNDRNRQKPSCFSVLVEKLQLALETDHMDVFCAVMRIIDQKQPGLVDKKIYKRIMSKQQQNFNDFFSSELHKEIDALLDQLNKLVDEGVLHPDLVAQFVHLWSGIEMGIESVILVICQLNYKAKVAKRQIGGLEDIKRIKEVAHTCGIHIIVRRDQTNVLSTIQRFRCLRPKHFIVTYMGHGCTQGVINICGESTVTRSEIMQFFHPSQQSPWKNEIVDAWNNISKVYFFQCCNGETKPETPERASVYLKNECDDFMEKFNLSTNVTIYPTPNQPDDERWKWTESMPPSTLIFLSSQPGMASSLLPQGSPFISKLCAELEHGAQQKYSLLVVMQKVAHAVANEPSEIRVMDDSNTITRINLWQQPCFISNLKADISLVQDDDQYTPKYADSFPLFRQKTV